MFGFMYDIKTVWFALIIVTIFGVASRVYVYQHVNRIVSELHDAVKYFTERIPDMVAIAAQADSATEAAASLEAALRQLSAVMEDRFEAIADRRPVHLHVVPADEDEGVS